MQWRFTTHLPCHRYTSPGMEMTCANNTLAQSRSDPYRPVWEQQMANYNHRRDQYKICTLHCIRQKYMYNWSDHTRPCLAVENMDCLCLPFNYDTVRYINLVLLWFFVIIVTYFIMGTSCATIYFSRAVCHLLVAIEITHIYTDHSI